MDDIVKLISIFRLVDKKLVYSYLKLETWENAYMIFNACLEHTDVGFYEDVEHPVQKHSVATWQISYKLGEDVHPFIDMVVDFFKTPENKEGFRIYLECAEDSNLEHVTQKVCRAVGVESINDEAVHEKPWKDAVPFMHTLLDKAVLFPFV